jgi:hypothetical protein
MQTQRPVRGLAAQLYSPSSSGPQSNRIGRRRLDSFGWGSRSVSHSCGDCDEPAERHHEISSCCLSLVQNVFKVIPFLNCLLFRPVWPCCVVETALLRALAETKATSFFLMSGFSGEESRVGSVFSYGRLAWVLAHDFSSVRLPTQCMSSACVRDRRRVPG